MGRKKKRKCRFGEMPQPSPPPPPWDLPSPMLVYDEVELPPGVAQSDRTQVMHSYMQRYPDWTRLRNSCRRWLHSYKWGHHYWIYHHHSGRYHHRHRCWDMHHRLHKWQRISYIRYWQWRSLWGVARTDGVNRWGEESRNTEKTSLEKYYE